MIAKGVQGKMLLSVPGGGISLACTGVGGSTVFVELRSLGSTKRMLVSMMSYMTESRKNGRTCDTYYSATCNAGLRRL